jgi:hypothetical protein
MKAVITADRRSDGGKLLENAEFLRFAAHWGFRIRACRPYRAQTKGKVERPVGYVRGNLIYGRDFLGDADLAAQSDHWLEHTANARVHGTTGAVPRERFEQEERAALQALPVGAYPRVLLSSARSVTVGPARRVHPLLTVERRPLGTYAALAEATS